MLHILWVILKIILIIIAILLGLVLLAAVLVLFVPIRYRGDGQKAEQLHGKVRVSWLLWLLTYTVEYREGKLYQTFRILGISPDAYRRFAGRIKLPWSHRKKKNKKRNLPKEPGTALPSVGEKKLGEEEQEAILRTEPMDREENSRDTRSYETRQDSSPGRFHPLLTLRRLFQKILSILRYIWKIPSKILKGIQKIALSCRHFCANIDRWKTFLEDERTREGLSLGWAECKRLLRHIGPTKISGNVIFGMEDPSVTGQVLGILGITMPIHKNVLEITPVFGENILKGQIAFRGRIYLFVLLKTAIKIYFDKNIKFMMKAMKKEG